MTEERLLLRPADLASQLGVCVSRVYQLVRAGEIPAVRVGGAIRVPREAWQAWLAEQRDKALASVRRDDSGAGDKALRP